MNPIIQLEYLIKNSSVSQELTLRFENNDVTTLLKTTK